jgi:hypothetical protein
VCVDRTERESSLCKLQIRGERRVVPEGSLLSEIEGPCISYAQAEDETIQI